MAGNIILPILSVFNGSGIKDATSQLNKFGSTVGNIQSSLKKFASAAVGAVVFRGTFNFLKESTVLARDYERELKALETIFGSAAPGMQAFAKNSAKIGLTTTESAKASVFLGSVLKQSGFEMGKVTDETKRLVGLASDLATVYGYDVQEALTGMTALFRGEYDPIEKFGVAMKQAEVNALLLERGQKNLTGSALRMAQAQARLDLLYQRSADSQGAFARGQGTLFVEQRNLTVAFENFQAQIAQAVIPALAKMMGLIGDFVTTNGPLLKTVFDGFATVVEELFKQLNDSQSELNHFFKTFVDLLGVIKDLSLFVAKHIALIVKLTAAYYGVVAPIKLWTKIVPLATLVTSAFETAMLRVAYAFDVTLLSAGLLTGVFGLLAIGLGLAVANTMEQTAATKDLLTEAANLGITVKATAMENSNMATQNLTDLQAQIDKVKKLNQSEEYRFLLRHNEHLLSLKQTADAKAQAKAEAEDFKKRIAEYKKGIADLLNLSQPLAFATRTMGQFESAVSSAFRNIYDKIHTGLADGLMTKKAHDTLIAYAQDESTQLGKIARMRDDFAKRYSLSETLIADTKRAFQEFASISNLMTDTGDTITKTTSYMVGKFKVTTSETVKAVSSATTLIDKYKNILANSKEFAKNLATLKAGGLSAELQQQILGGGLDQGGAMAAALVAGGPEAIKSMNALFAEISTVGSTVGESVASSLYGNGVDMTNGLLDGLLSGLQAMEEGGQKLADAFTKGFNNAMNQATSGKKVTVPTVDTGIAAGLASRFYPTTPGAGAGSNVTVNVSTGVASNPVEVGKTVVEYINKYAKVNGSPWVRAV